MGHTRTGSKAIARADRASEVLRLRREDYTLREIAAITGMDHSNIARLIEQHIADIPAVEAEDLRQREREKLNIMERSAQSQAYDFFAELGADGKPVMEPLCDDYGVVMLDQDGLPMWRIRRDFNPNNQARALLLKVHERRCKMFGLDAPVRTASTFEDVGVRDNEVTFRIVDAKDAHPLIQDLTDEGRLLVLKFIEDNKLTKQHQNQKPALLGSPV